MTGEVLLTLDQGTTNSKALLVARNGQVVATASRPVARSYPRPGWVEQDPAQLWSSIADAATEVLQTVPASAVVGVAVTNQRESVLAWWRSDGRPAGPCISWQCRRTRDRCDELELQGHGAALRRRTGLPIDPLFSATKAAWLLDQLELRAAAERGELCLGTVDSWLVRQLTGGTQHGIELGNASRTQLLDLERATWDDDLLALFSIPRAALPELRASTGPHGRTAAVAGLPADRPIVAVAADSHAALYGQRCTTPGQAKVTYGTGSSVMTPTDDISPSSHGLATTIAWQTGQVVYAREANITASGATIDWLAGLLGCADADAVAALARDAASSGGVHLVPAFAGLGAPLWDADARGALTGLTFGAGPTEVARAGVESIAFQVRDVLDALERDGVRIVGPVRADGGASRNPDLMAFQADLLGREVHVSREADGAALGVASMAGRELGWWEHRPSDPPEVHVPRMPAEERAARLRGWSDALTQVLRSAPARARHDALHDPSV